MSIKQSLTMLAILPLFLLFSCSTPEEKEEAGVIKQTTDTIAHEAVDRIQSPIDKATAIKELQENRDNTIQEAVEQQ